MRKEQISRKPAEAPAESADSVLAQVAPATPLDLHNSDALPVLAVAVAEILTAAQAAEPDPPDLSDPATARAALAAALGMDPAQPMPPAEVRARALRYGVNLEAYRAAPMVPTALSLDEPEQTSTDPNVRPDPAQATVYPQGTVPIPADAQADYDALVGLLDDLTVGPAGIFAAARAFMLAHHAVPMPPTAFVIHDQGTHAHFSIERSVHADLARATWDHYFADGPKPRPQTPGEVATVRSIAGYGETARAALHTYRTSPTSPSRIPRAALLPKLGTGAKPRTQTGDPEADLRRLYAWWQGLRQADRATERAAYDVYAKAYFAFHFPNAPAPPKPKPGRK